MTAPTHTRAEVEQLAHEYDLHSLGSKNYSDAPEVTPKHRAELLKDSADEAIIALALRQLAASIGAEPVGDFIRLNDGWYRQTFKGWEGAVPLYAAPVPSPTHREGELSGIEKAAKVVEAPSISHDRAALAARIRALKEGK